MTQSAGRIPSLIGRYEILDEIGRGAMGVVYSATDPVIGRRVAVKTVSLGSIQEESERDSMRQRLRREARAAGALSHPSIVTIYDVGEEEDLTYIVMEFVNGTNLEKILSSLSPQHTDKLFGILRRTAEGLDYAHGKGLVHRDVKPSNIMTANDGTVKIADFGIAKTSASTAMTHGGLVLGTPNYVSPEQAKGMMITGRADQFSLAVVACRMLTGKLPFSGPTLTVVLTKLLWEEPEHLNEGLNPEVRRVLLRALDKDPAKRFQTCMEFVEELSQARWVPFASPSAQQLEQARLGDPSRAPQEPILQTEENAGSGQSQTGFSGQQDSGLHPRTDLRDPETSGENRGRPESPHEALSPDSGQPVSPDAARESPGAAPPLDATLVRERPSAPPAHRGALKLALLLAAIVCGALLASYAAYRYLGDRDQPPVSEVTPSTVPSPVVAPLLDNPAPVPEEEPKRPAPPVALSRRQASPAPRSVPVAKKAVEDRNSAPVDPVPLEIPGPTIPADPAPPSPKAEPLSGVIVWTGRMVKNSILIISGNQASHGALAGGLPGIPVRIQLEPDTVVVREYPRSENNWARMILYSGRQLHSSIRIQWTATESEGPRSR